MKKSIQKRILFCSAMSVVVGAFLVSCGGESGSPQAICENLSGATIDASKFSLPTKGADITSTTYVSETTTGNSNGNYCMVLGSIHPVDKTAPDIKFQLNVPNTWNEKVLQSGGGGYNGSIPKTTGYTTLGLTNIPTPLASGYMTLADDSGHQAADSNDASLQ